MAKRRMEMPSLEHLAETLILADAGDPESVRELTSAFDEFAAWARSPGVAPEIYDAAADCVCVVGEISEADAGAVLVCLGELGHRFERLQSTVLAFTSDEPLIARGKRAPQAARASSHAGQSSGEGVAGIADDPALIADFVARASELLEAADEQLVVLERTSGRRDVLDEVFRAFHTLKGMAGFLSLAELQSTAHAAESILDGPRHGEARLEPRDLTALFSAVDEMKRWVAAVSGGAAADSGLTVTGAESPGGMTPGDGLDAERRTAEEATSPDCPTTALARATVRVDEGRLDRLLDAIGEMVIAESMASETARTDRQNVDRLSSQLARLDKITRELQELATSLRMMPIGPTFRRMSRIVRDLSHATGKRVELVMSGAETELDKEMVDRLGDPLIHLLRNAIDHGIESPAVREAAGKPAIGHVYLRAYHHAGSVLVEVADDGRGLAADAIVSRAREGGLLAEDTALDEQSMLGLILQPGFSTASVVTDVSGRGVGLDVVKRAVEDMRGQIEVSSTPGDGTSFTIRLPLTLAIIDGMVLRVGAERYIVPTGVIERSVRPLSTQLSTVLNRGSLLATEDGLVPLVHLGTLFEEADAQPDPCQAIVVICEAGGRRVGLVACELLGQQQTVIKGLGDDLRGASGLAGGAIMSDGRVGLILDVAGLVKLVNAGGGE